MILDMEDLIRLYNNTDSRIERANLWSHIENMIEDLAIETYPNEYETSLYYDEDYEDMLSTQRESFKKGYLSAIDLLLDDQRMAVDSGVVYKMK